MRKLLILILLLTLFISSVIPVNAAAFTYADYFYNVLDYVSVTDEGNYFSFNGSRAIDFDIGTAGLFNYCEILLNTSGVDVDVQVGDGNTYYSLTKVQLSSSLYRFYGNIPYKVYRNMTMLINGSSTSIACNLLSFKLRRPGVSMYFDQVGYWTSEDSNGIKYMDGQTDTTYYYGSGSENSAVPRTFSDSFYISNWRKYDYFDIRFNTQIYSITGFSCYVGEYAVPFQVSIYDGDPITYNPEYGFSYSENPNNYTGSGHIDLGLNSEFGLSARRSICISVDLSNVPRNFDGTVQISWSGSYAPSISQWTSILSGVGYVKTEGTTTQNTWYQKIYKAISGGFESLTLSLQGWFSSLGDQLDVLIDGKPEQIENADSFNDTIGDQSSELEEMTGIMDSVEKPDVGDINMDLSGMVDPTVITVATTGIGSLLSNQIILRVLLLSFTFGLIGFILYGKK